jgi:hypothetical protein
MTEPTEWGPELASVLSLHVGDSLPQAVEDVERLIRDVQARTLRDMSTALTNAVDFGPLGPGVAYAAQIVSDCADAFTSPRAERAPHA